MGCDNAVALIIVAVAFSLLMMAIALAALVNLIQQVKGY